MTWLVAVVMTVGLYTSSGSVSCPSPETFRGFCADTCADPVLADLMQAEFQANLEMAGERMFSLPNTVSTGSLLGATPPISYGEERPAIFMTDLNFRIVCLGVLDLTNATFQFDAYENHGGTLFHVGAASGVYWMGIWSGIYMPDDQTSPPDWRNIFSGAYFPGDIFNTGWKWGPSWIGRGMLFPGQFIGGYALARW